jgi:hypothetical protein
VSANTPFDAGADDRLAVDGVRTVAETTPSEAAAKMEAGGVTASLRDGHPRASSDATSTAAAVLIASSAGINVFM